MLTSDDVRRRRVGGAMAAVVGVLLLVLAVMAMTGKLGATKASDGVSNEAASAGATSGSAESGSTESGAGESGAGESGAGEPPASESESGTVTAPLTVLNAGGIAGLAGRGKQAFEAAGWQVTSVGNLSGSSVPKSSTVFYPANDQKAHAAAQSLVQQFPKLTADAAPAGLGHDGVVVVLTGDFVPGE